MHIHNISLIRDKKILILGATGQVGRRLVSILSDSEIPTENVTLIAQEPRQISYNKSIITCKLLNQTDLSDFDVVFNCLPGNEFQKYLGEIWNSKCIVIDKSNAFRLDNEVPLVVSGVNLDKVDGARLIASPNCIVIPLAIVLKTILSSLADVGQIAVSTYQSVSGAGNSGMNALLDEAKKSFFDAKVNPEYFEKQIVYNLIPKIGDFDENWSTDEENKIERETNRILESDLRISVIAVRVPVLVTHSIALHISCTCPNLNNTIAALESNNMIKLIANEKYMTPIETAHEDFVYVSRLKRTSSGIAMWITCDNVGRGAALNAVEIAVSGVSKLQS